MKFRNPSFNFSFEQTHRQTHAHTDKPKPICSPLIFFQDNYDANNETCLNIKIPVSFMGQGHNIFTTSHV